VKLHTLIRNYFSIKFPHTVYYGLYYNNCKIKFIFSNMYNHLSDLIQKLETVKPGFKIYIFQIFALNLSYFKK